jgi:outer membrane protein insertion porin family
LIAPLQTTSVLPVQVWYPMGMFRLREALYALFIILAVRPAKAQSSFSAPALAQFAGKRIAEIQYSPENTLAPADLARAQPLKVGDRFNTTDVSKSVDGLFATGWFNDIAVEAENNGDGVTLRFVTKPTWFVGGVTVEGKLVLPPNRGQVANTAQFSLGTPFHDEDVNNAVESIKKLMTSNGLYEASVSPSIERDSDAQQVFVTFQIKEGKRAKYEQPEITGGTLLSDSTIVRATGWRLPIIHRWKQVTERRTRKGIQGIQAKYQAKDRLTANVQVTSLDYDSSTRRVKPSVEITPGPKVEVKAVEAKVSKRVLKRYVPVFEERALYTGLLVEGKRNLQDYFQSKGYYDVDVEFREPPPSGDVQTVEYVISEGMRYKLSHLAIEGNKYFNTETIRERMFIAPASFTLRRGRYSEAFRRRDEETITNLYKSNGFQEVKVTSTVDRDYQGKPGDVAVTIKISEGPQWLVDTVTLNGVDQLQKNEIVGLLTSIPGQPFAEVNLARDRSAVLTYYFSRGFPSATMKGEWTQSSVPNHVNVVYIVQEGRRQYVRDVVISGLRTTRQKLIDRELKLKAGDPLSSVEETEIQKRFYDLGVFARVDTAIQDPDGDTEYKYVLYNFEEANRYNMSVGVGLQAGDFGTPSSTSASSPGGKRGVSPEVSADVSRLNFLGLGDSYSVRGLYSELEQRASLSYLQPRFRNKEGQNLTYTLLYDKALDVRTFASHREEASVQLTEKFSKSLNGLFRFAYRRVSVSDVVIPTLLVPQLSQPVRIGILSANLSQDRRDNATDPHRGMLNTLDVGLATKYFGSQRSFGRVLVANATYYRLSKSVVLARRTQFGIILPFSPPAGISAANSVPLPERLFGGGADSLRAFAFNQAGPRDTGTPVVAGGEPSQPTGFPLGGNALFFNTVELRFPLIGENIQGVIFHDMGNVFSSLNDMSLRFHQRDLQDFDYTVHAVGFGVRYKTPIGPIRLDLAYSLNPVSYVGFSGTASQLLNCNPNLPISSLPSYCQSTRQNTGRFQFFFSIGQAF